MWNKPSDEVLARMPRLYSTEGTVLKNKIIYEHFFLGGNDWYMAEYCPKDREFFGYAVLNADWRNSEWGYISFDELIKINVRGFEVDRDLYWSPKKFWDIQEVRKGYAYKWDQVR